MKNTVLLVLAVCALCAAVPPRIAGTPRPDARTFALARTALPAELPQPPAVDEDTSIIAYDDGTHRTWWCSDKDSFGVAVRFTPAALPCIITGARAEAGYDVSQEVYLRIFDATGPNGKPGTLLYEEHRLDIPHGQVQGFRDYDLTGPVAVPDGDFYICFWQKHYFALLFGSDTRMDSLTRQWWFFPDQGWVAPSGMDAADHLIRAKVVYPTGVADELAPSSPGFAIGPNPLRSGVLSICHLPSGICNPTSISVSNALGCRVLTRPVPASALAIGHWELELGSLPAGVYLVKLTSGATSQTSKLVIER